MERILAFSCHPDDLEFEAAGTLALLAAKGYEIHCATMTGGEVGSQTEKPQDIRNIRLKEAEESARVLKGTYHYAGGHDLQVEYNDYYRKITTRVLREVDPYIVLTQPPSDYLVDHEETSKLVRNAAFIASVPSFDCGVPTTPMKRIPYLYYWNAIDLQDIFGRPLPMHFGVDVASVMDKKEQMLACHKSQRDWLKYIFKWDAYMENMKNETRNQGKLIGREYGECFIQHLGSGHPQDNILGRILGDYLVDLLEK